MIDNKKLLDNIFITEIDTNEYTIFAHADKTWIMPKSSIKHGLDMYQPSTAKGKILKQCLIMFKSIPSIASKLGMTTAELKVNEDIFNYIAEVVGNKDFQIAAYMGDTSSRQNNKATIQIYDKYGIIAYAKITKDDEVKRNFDKEIEVLRFLEEKQIGNVPKVLGETEIGNLKIFVQSTEKGFNEKVKLKFGRKQIGFIKKLVGATAQKINYCDTDFYKDVEYLKECKDEFAEEQRKIIENVIKAVEEQIKEEPLEYAFSHGDYTPWNVYYTCGLINVFDFEYCSYSMPSYVDVFHYITQLSLLGKKCDVGGAVHNYRKYRKLIEEYVCNPDLIYACYILHIISFYKKRTEVNSLEMEDKYSKWIGILEYLNEKIK